MHNVQKSTKPQPRLPGHSGQSVLPLKDRSMHPSTYLFESPLIKSPIDHPEESILLTLLTTFARAVVPRELRDRLHAGQLTADETTVLRDLGMIIPDPKAEQAAMRDHIDLLNRESTHLDITLALNLDCNFACPYCFEDGVKTRDQYLTEAVTDAVLRFIDTQITETTTHLRVCFYGGEPLLSRPRIRHFSKAADRLCTDRGLNYRATMITNGSLLTRKTAEELHTLGLRSAKITLDGPPDLHNRSRPFRDGSGSFETVARNIAASGDLIDIELGGNYSQTTWPAFVRLVEMLPEFGIPPERLDFIAFGPIMENPDFSVLAPMAARSRSPLEDWEVEAEYALREACLKNGYRVPEIKPFGCTIDKHQSFIIGPDGNLYKCPSLIGRPDHVIGTVFTGITPDYQNRYNPDMWKTDDCLSCVFLPRCYGGCRVMSQLESGRMDVINCRKAHFEASLGDLLEQELHYAELFGND